MQLTKTNKEQTGNYKLSVLIHQDGLSFLCYNAVHIIDRWDYSFKYDSNPTEILEEIQKAYQDNEKLRKLEVDQVTLIYHHPIFSGVPASLFVEEHASNYLKYNNRLLETDVISYDEAISTIDYQTVYIAYSNINNFFFEKYGDFNFYHYTSLALNTWHKKYNDVHNAVILDVKESHMYLSLFNNGSLILHNVYQHDAIEDILYYTLFASEHNGLQPDQINLFLYQTQPSKDLYDLLYTYVKEVNVVIGAPQIIEQILCV